MNAEALSPSDPHDEEKIDLGRPPPADPRVGPLSARRARARHAEMVVLGDFLIRDKIGTGTQGAVYRAHQTSRNRPVALKVLSADAARRGTLVARFEREAAVLAGLDHPGIVRCYGVGEEHGFHYFAMEYVDGRDAASLLQRVGGSLPPAAALTIALRCAEALGHAAARHVIHRDVKPGNVLVGRRGEVKLTDWGLAKPTDEDLTLTGTHTGMGTLRYVAPEQVRDARRADHRSDLYALGGVLYELLTGRVPFSGDNWLEVLRAKEAAAFQPASAVTAGVPRRCDGVLARMLAPDPADRYPDYDALIGDLVGLGPTEGSSDLASLSAAAGVATRPAAVYGPPLRVVLVYDETDYVPLVQHALHAAGVPHDLTIVEDGRQAVASVGEERHAGGAARSDVLIFGLTSPTHDSVRVLTALRGATAPGPLMVFALSKSPDAATLLRALGLEIALWVTGFGDLEPLSEAVRSRYADAIAGRSDPV